MKNPEISVIVPVYNTSEYLEQCILSIINQTFKDFELICVDDGSTDGSLRILECFADQDTRLAIIHREKPSGSAALPRNIGLSRARGKYVFFVDSDDYCDVQMLEKMYGCAEREAADLVMCDAYALSSIDNSLKPYERALHHKYIRKDCVFSCGNIPDTIFQISNADIWHRLILRDLLVQHQLVFQENVPILDDILFVNLLQVSASRIFILDEKLVFHREARPGGQTNAIARHKESIYLAFEQLNKELMERGVYHQVRKSVQNWTLDALAWWYYEVKETKIEKELFLLYRHDYFPKLGLMNMREDEIYHYRAFYHYILQEDYKPSVSACLNAISPDGAEFVLYGAGGLGKDVYGFISSEQVHSIKLWCDKNAAQMKNPMVQSPEKIKDIEYDAVLIAIADKNVVLEVKAYLKALGVDEEKIYAV